MKTLVNNMYEVKPQNSSGTIGETKKRISRTTVLGLTYFSIRILIRIGFLLETVVFLEHNGFSVLYTCKNKLT
jgi:hypothetical protein